jgi:Sulfotransferase domain
MTERPDFVIAGAAKCGTTALFTYLAQHPSVAVPTEKEPGFFSADIPGGMSDPEEYRALFAAAPAHCLSGEASTRYLYSRVAIERLIAHNPRVKVIVLLRNPIDAVCSLHGYAYRYGHESIGDFERAWRAQGTRLGYEQAASRGDRPLIEYDYRATYHYAEQVRRVFEHVPPPQRLFVVYEEFFARPAAQYAGVLDFLSLAPAGPRTFEAVNTYEGVRSSRIESLIRNPPARLKDLYAPVRPLMKAAGLHPLRLLTRANRARREKPPLRPAFRQELEQYFAPDVAQLESLLGRRLWSAPEPQSAWTYGRSSQPDPGGQTIQ